MIARVSIMRIFCDVLLVLLLTTSVYRVTAMEPLLSYRRTSYDSDSGSPDKIISRTQSPRETLSHRMNYRGATRLKRLHALTLSKRTGEYRNFSVRNMIGHMFGFNYEGAGSFNYLLRSQDGQGNSYYLDSINRKAGLLSRNHMDAPIPPNFMVKLYRELSGNESGQEAISVTMRGNIVRSFFPSAGSSISRSQETGNAVRMVPCSPMGVARNTPIFVFIYDVTSIPLSEEVLETEVRVDSSGSNLRQIYNGSNGDLRAVISLYNSRDICNNDSDCTVNNRKIFFKVGETVLLNNLSSLPLHNRRLKRLVNKARKLHHVMILKLLKGTDNEAKIVQPKKSTRLNDVMPPNIKHEVAEIAQQAREGVSRIPILVTYCNDSPEKPPRRSVSESSILATLHNITPVQRRIRSVTTTSEQQAPSGTGFRRYQEMIGHSDQTSRFAANRKNVEKIGKAASSAQRPHVERRTKPRRRKSKCKNDDGARKGIMKKSMRRCEKKGRLQNLRQHSRAESGKRTNKPLSSVNKSRGDGSCQRKSLHVNFAEIKWSDWIISPTYFEAYYCTGHCKFSKTQESGMSNHAVIQSFARSFAGRTNIPEPCCVPDKLLPLSVLYYDEDNNVVLKVFSDMSVKSCRCR